MYVSLRESRQQRGPWRGVHSHMHVCHNRELSASGGFVCVQVRRRGRGWTASVRMSTGRRVRWVPRPCHCYKCQGTMRDPRTEAVHRKKPRHVPWDVPVDIPPTPADDPEVEVPTRCAHPTCTENVLKKYMSQNRNVRKKYLSHQSSAYYVYTFALHLPQPDAAWCTKHQLFEKKISLSKAFEVMSFFKCVNILYTRLYSCIHIVYPLHYC